MLYTVEPRYNKPPYNKALGITNNFLYPSNSKIFEKELRYNETSLWRTNLPVPWPFVISRFHCNPDIIILGIGYSGRSTQWSKLFEYFECIVRLYRSRAPATQARETGKLRSCKALGDYATHPLSFSQRFLSQTFCSSAFLAKFYDRTLLLWQRDMTPCWGMRTGLFQLKWDFFTLFSEKKNEISHARKILDVVQTDISCTWQILTIWHMVFSLVGAFYFFTTFTREWTYTSRISQLTIWIN